METTMEELEPEELIRVNSLDPIAAEGCVLVAVEDSVSVGLLIPTSNRSDS